MAAVPQTRKEIAEARTKRKIAITLIILALIVDCLGWFVFSSVAPIKIIQSEQEIGDYWPGEPTFSVFWDFTLKATGSISLNNVVQVSVLLSDNNKTSDFLQHYNSIGFTDAFSPKTVSGNNPLLAKIPLYATNNSYTYAGNGSVVWLNSGDTWPFLWPHVAANTVLGVAYPSIEFGTPLISIAGESDTLSIQNSIATARLTWILIGFSVLMLQPVLEAIRRVPKGPKA